MKQRQAGALWMSGGQPINSVMEEVLSVAEGLIDSLNQTPISRSGPAVITGCVLRKQLVLMWLLAGNSHENSLARPHLREMDAMNSAGALPTSIQALLEPAGCAVCKATAAGSSAAGRPKERERTASRASEPTASTRPRTTDTTAANAPGTRQRFERPPK